MRLLIDECLPRDLKGLFSEHECRTVQEMGWSGKENGDLLRLAQRKFDVLVTVDQRMEHEQDFTDLDIALLVLRARSNKVEDLSSIVPDAVAALSNIRPGQILRVGG